MNTKTKTMMDQTKQSLLALALVLGLANCASMVNQADEADRQGTAKIIGDQGITLSAKECKNGAIVTNLEQHNAGHVDVLASAALSEQPFEKDFDLYTLMGLRHTAFDPEVKYSEITFSPPVAEIDILLLTKEAASVAAHNATSTEGQEAKEGEEGKEEGKADKADSVKGMHHTVAAVRSAEDVEPEPYALTQIRGLHGQTIFKLDGGEKRKSQGSVCSVKTFDEEAPVYQKVMVTLDGEGGHIFDLPDPILSTKVKTIPVVKGVAGDKATFQIQPSSKGTVYVMFNNMQAKGDGKRYEMQMPSPADGNIEVPLKDVPAGSYHLFIHRMEKDTAALADDITACVANIIFVETSMTVEEPKKEEAAANAE